MSAINTLSFEEKSLLFAKLSQIAYYNVDIAKGKAAMEAVLKNDPRILQDQANVVAVVDLGSSSVDFLVRGFVKTEDYWSFYFDARPLLKAAVEEAGLTIPFPQRDVHVYQESA